MRERETHTGIQGALGVEGRGRQKELMGRDITLLVHLQVTSIGSRPSLHSIRPELRCRSGTEGLSGRKVLYYFLQWGALQGLGGGNWGPGIVLWCITSLSFGSE